MTLEQLKNFWDNYDPENPLGGNLAAAKDATAQFIADSLSGESTDDLTPMLTSAGNALGEEALMVIARDGFDRSGVIPDH